ncbi:skeletal muscle organ development [Homalodisca vitripennis]|nr:skeletal muscle organ development [Homalodisca vitripennis]
MKWHVPPSNLMLTIWKKLLANFKSTDYSFIEILCIQRDRLEISWLGHVHRRQEGTRLKEVYQAVPAGRRPLGRPKIRWCDQVVEDVTRCGGSVDLAEDRVAWKRLIDEAKNRLRFVTPRQTLFGGYSLQLSLISTIRF